MEQQHTSSAATILHELDLGAHTLFLMSDGSLDLLAHDEQAVVCQGNGLRLDHDEAYRLFVALQAQFIPVR